MARQMARKPHGRNLTTVVRSQGYQLRTKGVRASSDGSAGVNPKAAPVFVDRVYTAVNKGKKYPYASTKRRGKT